MSTFFIGIINLEEVIIMSRGRPKGGKNKRWTKDEKLRIIHRYFDEGMGQWNLAKQEGISRGMISKWVHQFMNEGEEGLALKKKSGNVFAALLTSQSLSEIERLRLTVAKQEIEIERLKKGYIVKGDGASKEFVTINDVNSKSSKD